MNENSQLPIDSFDSNAGIITGTGDVSALEGPASVSKAGGVIPSPNLITTSLHTTSIKDYISRPKLLYSGTVTDYITTPLVMDYAFDFLSSADIYEKLKYFNIVRGTFMIKLIITASPYATGILGLSSSYDTIAAYGAAVLHTPTIINNLQQKTHVNLDLGASTTALLSIPMHLRTPYVMNSNPDNTDLHKLKAYFYTLTDLSNSQTNTSVAVNYKIYVSLNESDVLIPTPNIGTYTSEMDRTFNGPISYPSSLLSMVGHRLSDVPVIGPFALAASKLTGGIADVAKLFGFSRPRDLGKQNYPHELRSALGVGEVQSHAITLDPKQEVTVDPSVFGEHGDNLSFSNTACRYGLIDKWQWTQAMSAGTQIFSIPVNPCLQYYYNASGTFYCSPNPASYVSYLFEAWRGEMVYKFVLPANRFVRGKIRIYWSPFSTVDTLALVTNNALSVLLDLSMTSTVELLVPWLSNNLYKTTYPFLRYDIALIQQQHNGYLHFVVEEPLIANNTSWFTEILVYQRCGDDFEFAIPTEKFLSNISYQIPVTPTVWRTPTTSAVAPPTAGQNAPSGQTDWGNYTSAVANNPEFSTFTTLLPDDHNEHAPHLHMGERITSLRSVLKRFTIYNSSIYNVAITTPPGGYMGWFVPYLPLPIATDVANKYTNNTNTPITHISRMFAGMRGSMRWHMTVETNSNLVSRFSRGFGFQDNQIWVKFINYLNSSNVALLNTAMADGHSCVKPTYEPAVFDIPFQNYYWWYPTGNNSTIGSNTYGGYFWEFYISNNYSPRLFSVAAGEDLQFVIYNGPPIIIQWNNTYTNS